MQFVAPSICLLSGHGAALTLAWFRPLKMRRRLLWAGMLGLVACGLVPQVVSSLVPYRMLYDHQSREFARWFWSKQGENAELVCFDLDVSLDRRGTWLGRKAWHLCNRMIYSPNRLRAGHVRDQEVSIDHPLRCVVYDERPEERTDDTPRPRIVSMTTHYDRGNDADAKEERKPCEEPSRHRQVLSGPTSGPLSIGSHEVIGAARTESQIGRAHV